MSFAAQNNLVLGQRNLGAGVFARSTNRRKAEAPPASVYVHSAASQPFFLPNLDSVRAKAHFWGNGENSPEHFWCHQELCMHFISLEQYSPSESWKKKRQGRGDEVPPKKENSGHLLAIIASFGHPGHTLSLEG